MLPVIFLNWQILQERKNILRLVMLYKIINGVVAIPSHPYLQPKLKSSRTHTLGFQRIQEGSQQGRFATERLATKL